MSYGQRFFGIISDVDGLSGIVVNGVSYSNDAQTAQARDKDGKVINMISYSIGKSVQVNGVVCGNAPAVGSTITFNGTTYIITAVSQSQSNTDFKQVSLSLKTADNAVLSGMV